MLSQIKTGRNKKNLSMDSKGLRILITGGRGYIGSALYRHLDSKRFVSKVFSYDLVDGQDICDPGAIKKFMQQCLPNVVIHLAALSSVSSCNESPLRAIKINAVGTRNVLDAMESCGCKHIIYASTSSVYGEGSGKLLFEDSPKIPCSAYGTSKLLGEQAIYNHYEVKDKEGGYLVFRMFNVVGPSGHKDLDSKKTENDRLFAALVSGFVTIYGTDYPTVDGTCERDYVSLKDVCRAYELGVIELVENGDVADVLNVCTGNASSVKSIISRWKLHNDITIKCGERRLGDPARVYGCNRAIKQKLGWEHKQTMREIISDLAVEI